MRRRARRIRVTEALVARLCDGVAEGPDGVDVEHSRPGHRCLISAWREARLYHAPERSVDSCRREHSRHHDHARLVGAQRKRRGNLRPERSMSVEDANVYGIRVPRKPVVKDRKLCMSRLALLDEAAPNGRPQVIGTDPHGYEIATIDIWIVVAYGVADSDEARPPRAKDGDRPHDRDVRLDAKASNVPFEEFGGVREQIRQLHEP